MTIGFHVMYLFSQPMATPREFRMKEDQDWTSVYPTAATFKWSAVPLPVRMGLPVNRGLPPHKYGNLELLKVSMNTILSMINTFPPINAPTCLPQKKFFHLKFTNLY